MQSWHSPRFKRACSIGMTGGSALVGMLLVVAWFQPVDALAEEKPGRTEAIGDLKIATKLEQAAYMDDAAFFEPIRQPEPMDWLAQHDEPGQTVAQFRTLLPMVKPRPQQTTLYILPVGEFKEGLAPSLDKLRDYCSAFFGMKTETLAPVQVGDVPTKSRINQGTQKRQLLTTGILGWLTHRKPKDAYALIAVTMEDLYPDEEWNFVFGQAMLVGGTGVFSFARYDPAFYGRERDAGTAALILRRSCKVLTHETGHMFGIKHCIFYECLMNGANHLGETDARPMRLCPVCLRKLQLGAGFNLLKRQEALQNFYEVENLEDEAAWSARWLEKLRRAR